MSITNITEEEILETYEQRFCSSEFTGEIHGRLIFLCVLNIFLSITAFLENTLILVALHKETSLHPPSKLLFRCLATTDLGVGLSEPLIVIYWLSLLNERWDVCRPVLALTFTASYMLSSVSLLTLTAISIDRLLALLLRLRYRQVVTLKRTYVTLATFWCLSIVGASAYFWNYLVTLYYSYIGLSVCLLISIFSYTKIFLTLHHQQVQVQTYVNQRLQNRQTISPLNITRYRKAVFSALWLQLTLIACYLPYSVSETFWTTSSSRFLLKQFGLTFVYLNSSLNPILYCWKIKEVRQAVKNTIRQLFCCSSC